MPVRTPRNRRGCACSSLPCSWPACRPRRGPRPAAPTARRSTARSPTPSGPPVGFGPGNRGIDFATEPGTPVTAAAGGEVTFAGPVGRSRHVVVLHPDGLRTSYSFLATVERPSGRPGRTGPDPRDGRRRACTSAPGPATATSTPPSCSAGPARSTSCPSSCGSPSPKRGSGRGSSARRPGRPSATSSARRRGRPAGCGTGPGTRAGWRWTWPGPRSSSAATRSRSWPTTSATRSAWPSRSRGCSGGSGGSSTPRPGCTPADQPPPARPPGRRIMVLVAGLGSSSDEAAVLGVDVAALGYPPGRRRPVLLRRRPGRAGRRPGRRAHEHLRPKGQLGRPAGGRRPAAGPARVDPGRPPGRARRRRRPLPGRVGGACRRWVSRVTATTRGSRRSTTWSCWPRPTAGPTSPPPPPCSGRRAAEGRRCWRPTSWPPAQVETGSVAIEQMDEASDFLRDLAATPLPEPAPGSPPSPPGATWS